MELFIQILIIAVISFVMALIAHRLAYKNDFVAKLVGR